MPVFIKWFPPSWFQIKTQRHIIYIDPAYLSTNFARYPKKIEYSKWPDPIDGLPEELEKGNTILITHHHKDHCKRVTVDRLKKDETKILATKLCMKELGKEITLVKPGMKIQLDNIEVETVEAYNVNKPEKTKIAHKKGNGVGYVLTVEGKRIYHAGDTDLISEMNLIKNIDIAMLPIGDRNFTMGVLEALQAAKLINPKIIIPMHCFDSDPMEYKKLVEKDTSTKVELLQIGAAYQL